MAIHIFGIRHHGPGSARNVKAFLEELKPDIVLIEGPPEADVLLTYSTNPRLVPPVAILAYQTDNIQKAVFYPFAEFSPEWQAIQYSGKAKIPARFMDLPLTHSFAIENVEEQKADLESTNEASDAVLVDEEAGAESLGTKVSPLQYLATAAGFEDEEKWWETTFEYRTYNEEIFTAVHEAMQVLRQELPNKKDSKELLREAWMRKMIRQAEKELYQNIAVVCGAWHTPALANMPKAKDDNEILKGLPKVKVETTWIPWTYNRLSLFSGYGAGISSPGWYDHIWHFPQDDGTLWMTKVASLFRKNQMDTSVAHIIEAVRLATSLAALRNIPKPGLEELNEATLSVLCNGESILMELIEEELIVSNRLGAVPDEIPKPPLQVDIEKKQKYLRLPPSADWKDYMLDLRKENDLERSIFLNRLNLLGIDWGKKSLVSGKGTFKEQWRLQWNPNFVIAIIERGVWGNTLEEASNRWLIHNCNQEKSLSAIVGLLEQVIPADLSGAAKAIAIKLQEVSAATNDVMQLVEVLPGLTGIMRYGNVRKTDAKMVRQIVESMITRICIGLPNACCGIDENMARKLTEDCIQINHSIQLLQEKNYAKEWFDCLMAVSTQNNAAAMMKGFATRQLMDAGELMGDVLLQLFYSSLSKNLPVTETAAWLEGFLKGSGTLLLIDDKLWQIVNDWIQQLDNEGFIQALPLMRRTFSQFTVAERRKLGEKAKNGGSMVSISQVLSTGLDSERAKKGLLVVMQLMGYSLNEEPV